jgi:XRE family transcriptional regulator of biofilm formation
MLKAVRMGQKKASDHREPGTVALGYLLRSRREAAGLSLTQMAKEFGISHTYLGRLERGEYAHPTPVILGRVAKCLQVRLEDLYALAGITLPTDLPEFGPYLRAKHPDWPTLIITELDDYCDFLKHKYSLQ